MNSTLQNAVKAGATWLDEQRPSWYKEVPIRTLDMDHADTCVLGHIGKALGRLDSFDSPPTYWRFVDGCDFPASHRHLGMDRHQAAERGFSIEGFSTGAAWAALDALWRNEIRERRGIAYRETV